MSPQARYNRQVRADSLVRQLQASRQRELRAEHRRALIEIELQCWIYQLEYDAQLDEGAFDDS